MTYDDQRMMDGIDGGWDRRNARCCEYVVDDEKAGEDCTAVGDCCGSTGMRFGMKKGWAEWTDDFDLTLGLLQGKVSSAKGMSIGETETNSVELGASLSLGICDNVSVVYTKLLEGPQNSSMKNNFQSVPSRHCMQVTHVPRLGSCSTNCSKLRNVSAVGSTVRISCKTAMQTNSKWPRESADSGLFLKFSHRIDDSRAAALNGANYIGNTLSKSKLDQYFNGGECGTLLLSLAGIAGLKLMCPALNWPLLDIVLFSYQQLSSWKSLVQRGQWWRLPLKLASALSNQFFDSLLSHSLTAFLFVTQTRGRKKNSRPMYHPELYEGILTCKAQESEEMTLLLNQRTFHSPDITLDRAPFFRISDAKEKSRKKSIPKVICEIAGKDLEGTAVSRNYGEFVVDRRISLQIQHENKDEAPAVVSSIMPDITSEDSIPIVSSVTVTDTGDRELLTTNPERHAETSDRFDILELMAVEFTSNPSFKVPDQLSARERDRECDTKCLTRGLSELQIAVSNNSRRHLLYIDSQPDFTKDSAERRSSDLEPVSCAFLFDPCICGNIPLQPIVVPTAFTDKTVNSVPEDMVAIIGNDRNHSLRNSSRQTFLVGKKGSGECEHAAESLDVHMIEFSFATHARIKSALNETHLVESESGLVLAENNAKSSKEVLPKVLALAFESHTCSSHEPTTSAEVKDTIDESYLHPHADHTARISLPKVQHPKPYLNMEQVLLAKCRELVFWHGLCKEGRPTLCVMLGRAFRTLSSSQHTHFISIIVSHVEYAELNYFKGAVKQFNIIMDLEGIGLMHIPPPHVLQSLGTILNRDYAGRGGTVFFVNAPMMLSWALAALRTVMLRPSSTKGVDTEKGFLESKEALVVLGWRYKQSLKRYFESSMLPRVFGGKCECTQDSDSCPVGTNFLLSS